MKNVAISILFLSFLCVACSRSGAVQAAQSQSVAPQTNGRGGIGLTCRTEANGRRVGRMIKDGPAESAGLRVGDLLLRLNPSDQAGVVEQIAKNPPGTKITLPIQRGSEQMQVAITVEDQLAVALHGATLGDPAAEETVGGIYRRGAGVPKDPAEALKWLRKAAEQGYDVAQVEIGWMYGNGEGVPHDDRTAVEWYRKAAEQGHAPAEVLLGAMYVQGRGVTKDDKAAVEWYRKASEQGMANAQAELGAMYARGQGVPQDYSAAAEWYRKAAQQGDSMAEYNLGLCYENGRGVPKDLKAAVDWYTKAAAQGLEPAKEKLAKLHQ
jgi:TPR repeat protein